MSIYFKTIPIMSEIASFPIESATYIEIDAQVRYWEDAFVNGERDTDGSRMPLRKGEAWCPVIRLADGVVQGWPQGVTARTCYKVCDEGLYWLLNDQHERVAKWRSSYVPATMLDQHDSSGEVSAREVGDYVVLRIDAQGRIENWRTPHINLERWVPLTQISQGTPS